MAAPTGSLLGSVSPSTSPLGRKLGDTREPAPSNDQVPNHTFFWFTEPPTSPGEPDLVSVAEVMTGSPSLISVRLYYRPEDTPAGRSWRHGADEVLASRRHSSLPVDAAVAMRNSGQSMGDVTVLSYRDYCREKARIKRLGVVAAGVPPGTRFFVREDYKDPVLESRDNLIIDDVDL